MPLGLVHASYLASCKTDFLCILNPFTLFLSIYWEVKNIASFSKNPNRVKSRLGLYKNCAWKKCCFLANQASLANRNQVTSHKMISSILPPPQWKVFSLPSSHTPCNPPVDWEHNLSNRALWMMRSRLNRTGKNSTFIIFYIPNLINS